MAAGSATISASLQGVSASATLAVTNLIPVSITVTPTNPSIAKGTSRQFVATGIYRDNSTQDLSSVATWTSGTPAVATVTPTGLALGATVGNSTITATFRGISGDTRLTVTAAELVSLAVTPTNQSVAKGQTKQFTATGTYTDSTTQDLTTTVTWASTDPNKVTISNANGSHGLASTLAIGAVTVSATDPTTQIVGNTGLTVTAATLVSIGVTPATPSVAKGLTKQFTATGTYTDSTTQDLTTTVTWSSGTPATATVSNANGSQGLASSLAVGTATITATHPATQIAGNTTLTVTAATLVSVAVTPTNPSIAKGLTKQFTATGTYTDSTTQDLTTTVTWSSGTPAKATISNANGSQGLATSVAAGQSVITATDPTTQFAGNTTLTVTAAALISIAVTPTNPSVAKGRTQQFTATGTYTDTTTQNLTTTVTWASSDTNAATISNANGSQGLASALTVGSPIISATDATTQIAGNTTLTVSAAALVSIAVTPANPSVAKGLTKQFTATGTYTDATTQDLTTTATWASSDTAKATISNAGGSQGLASTVGVGQTTISATDPTTQVAGNTELTVSAATLASIAVTPANPSIALGATQQFIATGTWTDSTTQILTTTVTWASSDEAKATISNAGGTEGLATAIANGSPTISATDALTSVVGTTTLTVKKPSGFYISNTSVTSATSTYDICFLSADYSSCTVLYSFSGHPGSVAFDASDNMYVPVLETGKIIKITPDGTQSDYATGLSYPKACCFDNSGNLFVSSETGYIYRVYSNGSTGTTATGLGTLYGLTFDGTRNVFYTAEVSGKVIRKILADGSFWGNLSANFGGGSPVGAYYAANMQCLIVPVNSLATNDNEYFWDLYKDAFDSQLTGYWNCAAATQNNSNKLFFLMRVDNKLNQWTGGSNVTTVYSNNGGTGPLNNPMFVTWH